MQQGTSGIPRISTDLTAKLQTPYSTTASSKLDSDGARARKRSSPTRHSESFHIPRRAGHVSTAATSVKARDAGKGKAPVRSVSHYGESASHRRQQQSREERPKKPADSQRRVPIDPLPTKEQSYRVCKKKAQGDEKLTLKCNFRERIRARFQSIFHRRAALQDYYTSHKTGSWRSVKGVDGKTYVEPAVGDLTVETYLEILRLLEFRLRTDLETVRQLALAARQQLQWARDSGLPAEQEMVDR